MCLVSGYEAFAGQAKVSYFDIIDAIRANAYKNVVWLEITMDNIQAVEFRKLVVSQIAMRKETPYLCTWTSPCNI